MKHRTSPELVSMIRFNPGLVHTLVAATAWSPDAKAKSVEKVFILANRGVKRWNAK